MRSLSTLCFFLLVVFNSYSQNFIELKNGDVKNFKKVELIQEKYEKPYLKTETGEIYRTEQIVAFQSEEGYFVKNNLTSNKNDFAKRVLNGRVQIYQYDLSSNYIQTGQSSERDYYAYQKYKEPIKQMIYKNLIKDLGDNSESVRKLEKINKAKKIAPLYYVLGGVSLVSAGILFNTDNNEWSTPLFLGGITFISIPWIMNSKRQKHMDDAVRIYNAN